MDALVIGPPGQLTAALSSALIRGGRTVLQATPADAADGERAAWLLAEAGQPPLVLVCEPAPYTTAQRLLASRRRVVAIDERHLPVVTANRRPSHGPAGRALARAARRRGGVARIVPLGRAGRRWIELGVRGAPLSADGAAGLVLRAYAESAIAAAPTAGSGEPPR